VGQPRLTPVAFVGTDLGMDCGQAILEYGRRRETLDEVLSYLQLKLGPLIAHHRDLAGCEAMVHKFCRRRGIPRVIHQGKAMMGGPDRAMIHLTDGDEGKLADDNLTRLIAEVPPTAAERSLLAAAKLLIALPEDNVERPTTTWKCVKRAREAGLWIIKLYPDGSWDDEGQRPLGIGDVDTGHDFASLGDQCARCGLNGSDLAGVVFDGDAMPLCEAVLSGCLVGGHHP